MVDAKFIHLKVYSDYSLIQGICKPELLVNTACNLDFPAIAMTDINNLFGIIKFYKSAKYLGIKPIIGVDFKVFSLFFKRKLVTLTLLAKNNEGYNNLIILVSKAYQQGSKFFKSNIFIHQKWLLKYGKGLIILSGGINGDFGLNIIENNYSLVKECILFYKRYFLDNFYIEIMRINFFNEEKYLEQAVNIAISEDLPVVATNPVCFINKKDFCYHTIKVSINQGLPINDSNFLNEYTDNQYLKTHQEMKQLFSDIPESIQNSFEIAKRCNVSIKFKKRFLPKFFTGTISESNYLILKSKEGLENRLNLIYPNKKIRARCRNKYDLRLLEELDVINKMRFPGYFLIVMEFVHWAKKNNIPVGPGRGSGAGSLVAYCLSITEVDPLSFDLLFERFLNSERVSLPDFDIDFCIKKRDRVIEHVSNLYGIDSVSQIITFGTMTAKAVIRDVGRALGYPYGFINSISKLIPLDPGITLKKALLINSELSNLYSANKDVKILIKLSKKLEGVTRNIGKHAGGLVISPTKIIDFSPLYFDETGIHHITQFDKDDIENVGLVKFDFLGLKTLTIIDFALKMINKKKFKNSLKKVNINEISLKDIKCYNFLQTSETTGIFQLESQGMKDLIKRLQPDSFEDIVSLVALFRPGPLQSGMVDNFINRKHSREKIFYPDKKWQHNLLKPILKSTYGIILYQEQVMKIAQVLSGYTLAEADILRRAMGKKNPKEMQKQRIIFEKGAKKNNIDSKLSIKIFDLLEKFSGYGFNKSHSVAYALISYQTLWLKVNYPLEFFSSVLTAEIDNTKKLTFLVKELSRMKIKLISPNINVSKYYFYANNNNEIVCGLGVIKGIGKNIVLLILESRKKFGFFLDLFNFCVRLDSKKLTNKIMLKIIMSGAFDVFNIPRYKLSSILTSVMNAAKQYLMEIYTKKKNLFENHREYVIKHTKNYYIDSSKIWTDIETLNYEKEILGFYLSGHPINFYEFEINNYIKRYLIKDVKLFNKNKYYLNIVGLVNGIKRKKTIQNKDIYTLSLDDGTDTIELILFINIWEKYKDFIYKDNLLFVNGYVSCRPNSQIYKFIPRNIIDISIARKKQIKSFVIFLNEQKLDTYFLESLHNILEKYSNGPTPVYIKYQKTKISAQFSLGKNWFINITDMLIHEARILCGSSNIHLRFKKELIEL